jgi:hypothetical protein
MLPEKSGKQNFYETPVFIHDILVYKCAGMAMGHIAACQLPEGWEK